MSKTTANKNKIPKNSAMTSEATVVWFLSFFPRFSWTPGLAVDSAVASAVTVVFALVAGDAVAPTQNKEWVQDY